MWLLDPLFRPAYPNDTLAFLRAEDAFDLGGRLGDIAAPTLVIGGEHDIAYETDNFRLTAEGIADSKLIIYPRTTHLGAVKHPRFARDIVDFLSAA